MNNLCNRWSWKLVGTLPGMVQTIMPKGKGFDSILLQSAVMYYDIIMTYGTLSFAIFKAVEDT